MRFVAHRGTPSKAFSNKGTNLVGVQSELRTSLKDLDRCTIVAAARRLDIDWSFNAPLASTEEAFGNG